MSWHGLSDDHFFKPAGNIPPAAATAIAQLVCQILKFSFSYNTYDYVSFKETDLANLKRVITRNLQEINLPIDSLRLLTEDAYRAIAGTIELSPKFNIAATENNGIITSGLVKAAFNQSHIWKANLSSAAAMFGRTEKNPQGRYYALFFDERELNSDKFAKAMDSAFRETLLALQLHAQMAPPPPYSPSVAGAK